MANPNEELDELFHQPTRLELMADLCSTSEGRTFTELRERCGLTDGNLSRHLQALERGGMVKIKKAFVDSKPQTTALVTAKGREQFLTYLDTLEKVLKSATKRASGTERSRAVAAAKAVKS